jgi:hypothetical protein
MFKKFILFFIVIIEVLLGIFFLYRYYQKNILSNKVLAEKKIALIDKSKIVVGEDEDLKHYWKFYPNQDWGLQPEWLPYEVKYQINEDGLNDSKDYTAESQPNTYRIITLGDSFTFGHYVNTKDNWTEQLEVLLNNSSFNCKYDNFEVINLGMPGYDIPYIVQRYKEFGKKYNPDLILWFESSSGFYRLNEFIQPIIKSCKDHDTARIKNLSNHCWDEAGKQLEEKYSIFDLSQIFTKYFDDFFDLVSMEKTNFIYFNPLKDKEKEVVAGWQERYYDARFLFLDIKTKDEEKLADGHLSKEGHSTTANRIFNYLNNNLKICEK